MTQLEFASRMGISESRLSQIERGSVPPEPRLIQMVEAFGGEENLSDWLNAAGYVESEGEGQCAGNAAGAVDGDSRPACSDAAAVAEWAATLPLLGKVHEGGRIEYLPERGEAGVVAIYSLEVVDRGLGAMFLAGDLIVIETERDPAPGDWVIVKNGEDDFWLVRFASREADKLRVQPIRHLGIGSGTDVSGSIVGVLDCQVRLFRKGRGKR